MRGKRYIISIPFEKAAFLEWLGELLNEWGSGCWFINPDRFDKGLDVIFNDVYEQWDEISYQVEKEVQRRYGDDNNIIIENS